MMASTPSKGKHTLRAVLVQKVYALAAPLKLGEEEEVTQPTDLGPV